MQTAGKKEPKPFHEAVVETIFCCPRPKLEFLASIITATKIPRNHDYIISAWQTRAEEMGWDEEDNYGVIAHVLAQKEESEKKSGAPETKEKSAQSAEATVN